jgi:hypothetical protein
MIIRRTSTLCMAMLLAAGAAHAQEHGTVGITMGYPASLGIIFHATDTVAIRPEFSFTRNSTDGDLGADSWQVGTGISALFYLASSDHVHTYVSPRLTYARSRTTVTPSGFSSKNTSWGLIGSFGAQYAPVRSFSVFGEIGLGYTRQSATTTGSAVGANLNQIGTRAGVGIIFYP